VVPYLQYYGGYLTANGVPDPGVNAGSSCIHDPIEPPPDYPLPDGFPAGY
jgi:hypothetical protein